MRCAARTGEAQRSAARHGWAPEGTMDLQGHPKVLWSTLEVPGVLCSTYGTVECCRVPTVLWRVRTCCPSVLTQSDSGRRFCNSTCTRTHAHTRTRTHAAARLHDSQNPTLPRWPESTQSTAHTQSTIPQLERLHAGVACSRVRVACRAHRTSALERRALHPVCCESHGCAVRRRPCRKREPLRACNDYNDY